MNLSIITVLVLFFKEVKVPEIWDEVTCNALILDKIFWSFFEDMGIGMKDMNLILHGNFVGDRMDEFRSPSWMQ